MLLGGGSDNSAGQEASVAPTCRSEFTSLRWFRLACIYDVRSASDRSVRVAMPFVASSFLAPFVAMPGATSIY